MKLTKEECKGIIQVVANWGTYKQYLAIKELVKEHFDNPPLKFEELKEGMWVWDNKEKMYGKIAHEPYQRFGLLTVPGYMWGVFEENRFYRREVINNED